MEFEKIREELKNKFKIDIEEFKPQIVGSKVKKEDIVKHELKNLIRGIEVEREHTSDNMIALEIALRHLNEGENYYEELDKMEKKLDETTTAGAVAPIETPTFMNPEKTYKNFPAFDLSDTEFRDFVKKKQVPQKVKKYMDAQKTSKVYLLYNSMSFRLDKILNVHE